MVRPSPERRKSEGDGSATPAGTSLSWAVNTMVAQVERVREDAVGSIEHYIVMKTNKMPPVSKKQRNLADVGD